MDYPKTPSFNLNGKRSLVTGAGRGIGMGASIALAQAGSEIVMVSRTEEQLIALNDHIKNLGLKSSYKPLDVTNDRDLKEFINNEKPFDILVNNAGTNIPSSLIETKIDDFDYVMSLNVKSVINLTKHVVTKMLDNNIQGSIINLSLIHI